MKEGKVIYSAGVVIINDVKSGEVTNSRVQFSTVNPKDSVNGGQQVLWYVPTRTGTHFDAYMFEFSKPANTKQEARKVLLRMTANLPAVAVEVIKREIDAQIEADKIEAAKAKAKATKGTKNALKGEKAPKKSPEQAAADKAAAKEALKNVVAKKAAQTETPAPAETTTEKVPEPV